MNAIDSGANSTAGLATSAGTITTGTLGDSTLAPSTVTSSGIASTTSMASPSSVSPALQACRCNNLPDPSGFNANPMALMSQLMEALVNVMTTLMNMLQTMMCRLNGVPGNSGNGAGVDNGGNTSGPVGSGNGGSVGNSNNSRNTGATDGTGGGTPGDVGGQAPLTNPGSSLGGIQSALDVNRNDAGMITVRTLDGYTVRAEGRDQAWSITGPDGRATRIWGDPHVSESDGDRWDFLNRSTFMFGKNKVTVEVVPAGNGQTLSARITIYSDKERVTIDGIEKNQPSIVAASSDGLQHDASLADGDIYKRVVTPTGESWVSATTGQVVPVSR